MKQLLLAISLMLSLSIPATIQAAHGPVFAVAAPPDTGGTAPACDTSKGDVPIGVKILNNGDNCVHANKDGGVIYGYLRLIIIFLSGLVGLGVVLMLVWGGVQYTMSAGNPANIAAAKSRIMNALIGLVLFILMYGILNFLIPGGIL